LGSGKIQFVAAAADERDFFRRMVIDYLGRHFVFYYFGIASVSSVIHAQDHFVMDTARSGRGCLWGLI
jgi:hypothetical protein